MSFRNSPHIPEDPNRIPDKEYFEALRPGATQWDADINASRAPKSTTPEDTDFGSYSSNNIEGATPPYAAKNNASHPSNPGASPAAPQQKQPAHPARKISSANAFLMIIVAIFFDAAGALLAASVVGGWIVAGIGVAVFIVWFLILGLPLLSPKTAAKQLVNLGGEALTAGLWTGFTVGVALIIGDDRLQEKTGISAFEIVDTIPGKMSPAKTGATPPHVPQPKGSGSLPTGATHPGGRVIPFPGNNTVPKPPKVGDTVPKEKAA